MRSAWQGFTIAELTALTGRTRRFLQEDSCRTFDRGEAQSTRQSTLMVENTPCKRTLIAA